jgi:hypothetical protein
MSRYRPNELFIDQTAEIIEKKKYQPTRTRSEEGVCVEQEYRSFDRRHFLEYGIQNGDPGREGYTHYTHYTHYTYYVHYTNYTHYCRFVKILDLRITFGRTRGRRLPDLLITWAISFVLPCVLGGFPTSAVCTERRMV